MHLRARASFASRSVSPQRRSRARNAGRCESQAGGTGNVRESVIDVPVKEERNQMLKWTHPATSDLVLDRLNKILGLNEKGEVTLGWTPGIFDSLAELLAEH